MCLTPKPVVPSYVVVVAEPALFRTSRSWGLLGLASGRSMILLVVVAASVVWSTCRVEAERTEVVLLQMVAACVVYTCKEEEAVWHLVKTEMGTDKVDETLACLLRE